MKSWKEHTEKRQEFLAHQLELISKESESAVGSELKPLTDAMYLTLKAMSIPYILSFGIIFAVLIQALICVVVSIKILSYVLGPARGL